MKSLDEIIKQCPPEISGEHYPESFSKGETIILQGLDEEFVRILLSGTVRIYCILSDGKEYTLIHLKDSNLIGELEMFARQEAVSMAQAETDCTTIRISKPIFLRWMQSDWDFTCYVMNSLAERVSYLTANTVHRASLTIEERLGELLEQAASKGEVTISKDTISGELYTTERSVNRALKKFSDAGRIAIENNKIVIKKGEKPPLI